MISIHSNDNITLTQEHNINTFFTNKLKNIPCDENVKSYIIGIFSKYKTSNYDLSTNSITIEYNFAMLNNNFEKFQTIADYLFFMNALYPKALKNASKDYYHSIGKLSYFHCYRIIREFKIYELLADDFITLSQQSGKILLNS